MRNGGFRSQDRLSRAVARTGDCTSEGAETCLPLCQRAERCVVNPFVAALAGRPLYFQGVNLFKLALFALTSYDVVIYADTDLELFPYAEHEFTAAATAWRAVVERFVHSPRRPRPLLAADSDPYSPLNGACAQADSPVYLIVAWPASTRGPGRAGGEDRIRAVSAALPCRQHMLAPTTCVAVCRRTHADSALQLALQRQPAMPHCVPVQHVRICGA